MTDEQLLDSFLSGNESAFTELVTRYEDRLVRYAARYDLADAEDIVQEAWTRVVVSASSFDPDKAPVKNWLYTIVGRIGIDRTRSKKRRPTVNVERIEAATYDNLSDRLDAATVRQAVDRLPEGLRLPVILSLEGKSFRQASPQMGISYRQVGNRYAKAMDILREWLGA